MFQVFQVVVCASALVLGSCPAAVSVSLQWLLPGFANCGPLPSLPFYSTHCPHHVIAPKSVTSCFFSSSQLSLSRQPAQPPTASPTRTETEQNRLPACKLPVANPIQSNPVQFKSPYSKKHNRRHCPIRPYLGLGQRVVLITRRCFRPEVGYFANRSCATAFGLAWDAKVTS